MAQNQIIDGTTFDASKIRYTSPKVNQSGGKSVGILSTMTNTALKIQTPSMLTWGLSDYEGNEKFEVSLQFPTEEYDTDELRAFRQNMVEFENKIKADALTNSKAWFGKQHNSPEVLEALWTPILKYTKDKATGEPDKTKSPTLRVKVPYYEQQWKVEVYDEKCERLFPNDTEETPVELIKKGMRIVTLMQCGGLWFVSGKFGVTWKLVQAVVPRENNSNAGCLIRMKSSPQEVQGEREIMREASVMTVETTATVVEDSDDENTQGDDAEVENTLLQEQEEPKKRVVRRKRGDV